jgi:hypothetical protein
MTHLTSPLTSPRTLGSSPAAAGAHPPGRALLITALLLAGRALERLATRLATRLAHGGPEQRGDGREFHVVEQDGRHIGMLYEDGRLVALLPEIGRL